ncbi:MAG: AcrR family transcriptional regulator [Flavobacteriales bacterium]|jgi:AcrR family transcriptional regulator
MQTLSGKEDIREKLILSAISLYAQKGIDGVSLREIGVSSGAKNSGVMQYHFGSKLGLLSAIMEKIVQHLLLLKAQNPPQEAEDIDTLVKQTVKNIATIVSVYDWGEDAVKVMSRMLMETSDDIRNIINRYFSEHSVQLYQRISTFYPDVESNKIKLRVLLALDCIIHGMSESKSLSNSPVGKISFYNKQELVDQLSDFIVGGITYKL